MHRMLKLKIDVVDDFAVHFHRTLSNQAPGFAGRFGELEHIDYESANPDRLGRGKIVCSSIERPKALHIRGQKPARSVFPVFHKGAASSIS